MHRWAFNIYKGIDFQCTSALSLFLGLASSLRRGKTFVPADVVRVFTTACGLAHTPFFGTSLLCCVCNLDLSVHLSWPLNQSWIRSLESTLCPISDPQGQSYLVTTHPDWVRAAAKPAGLTFCREEHDVSHFLQGAPSLGHGPSLQGRLRQHGQPVLATGMLQIRSVWKPPSWKIVNPVPASTFWSTLRASLGPVGGH